MVRGCGIKYTQNGHDSFTRGVRVSDLLATTTHGGGSFPQNRPDLLIVPVQQLLPPPGSMLQLLLRHLPHSFLQHMSPSRKPEVHGASDQVHGVVMGLDFVRNKS